MGRGRGRLVAVVGLAVATLGSGALVAPALAASVDAVDDPARFVADGGVLDAIARMTEGAPAGELPTSGATWTGDPLAVHQVGLPDVVGSTGSTGAVEAAVAPDGTWVAVVGDASGPLGVATIVRHRDGFDVGMVTEDPALAVALDGVPVDAVLVHDPPEDRWAVLEGTVLVPVDGHSPAAGYSLEEYGRVLVDRYAAATGPGADPTLAGGGAAVGGDVVRTVGLPLLGAGAAVVALGVLVARDRARTARTARTARAGAARGATDG